MDPPLLIINTEHRNNQNNIYNKYIPYIILYICLFAIAWYGFDKNYIHPDYHFGVKIILFSLPIIFGLNNLDEYIEEDYINSNDKDNFKDKINNKSSNKNSNKNNKLYNKIDDINHIKFINKIKYQLIDIQNKNTLALVDEFGNVQFINEIFNKKYKNNKKSWYNSLKS